MHRIPRSRVSAFFLSYRYVQHNSEGRSDVCILDASQIVIAFNPMGSNFLMLFAVFYIHYNYYVIIIIIIIARVHYRQVAGACECGEEPSGSIKRGEFLDQLQTS